jgi:hypothetical protein
MKKILGISIIFLFNTLNSCFAQTNNIKVIKVEKSKIVQKETNQSIIDACSAWTLTKEEVAIFFTHSKLINSYEKNNHYYFMPCEIKGTLVRNDTTFNFSINAGSTAELIFRDIIFYYGCSDNICSKLVLMPPDIGNEEY